MTEPLGRMDILSELGAQPNSDFETDTSLDEAQVNEEPIYDEADDFLGLATGVPPVEQEEAAPGEEYVDESEEGWEYQILDNVAENMADEDVEVYRDPALAEENAYMRGRLEAAEQQIVEPQEPEAPAQAQPLDFQNPEILKALQEKIDNGELDASTLSSIVGTYSEAVARNLYGSKIEALEAQQSQADEFQQNQNAYTEVQRNLSDSLSEAAQLGDLEAAVVAEWQENGTESYLYPYFEDLYSENPALLATPTAIINAVQEVASDLYEYNQNLQELQEGEYVDTGESVETAAGSLVGSRSEVSTVMNRAVRQAGDGSSNPQMTDDERLVQEIMDTSSKIGRLGPGLVG